MGLMSSLTNLARSFGADTRSTEARSFLDWPFDWTQGGLMGPLRQTIPGEKQETPDGSFRSYVLGAYQTNGIVFACMRARRSLFTEARFQLQRLEKGRPGDLYGLPALDVLQSPWPGGSTGDLLGRMIDYADLGGDAFVVRVKGGLRVLRPDWVVVIVGSPSDPGGDTASVDAQVYGYVYYPGGQYSGAKPEILLPEQVAHFAPIPDPLTRFRGMSWLTPVIREVMADSAARDHKLKFFENGATPNMVVSLDPAIQRDAFNDWVEAFNKNQTGVRNAYKTLFLGAGAKVEVVGADMRTLDFKQVQGAGETRIAAAAGVPPIIVGLSEGLQAATYSNYGQARRAFADGTMRPLWRMAAAALDNIIPTPSGSRLWYDDRDISFLQEDVEDDARIRSLNAASIRTLVDAGFLPDTVVDAVDAGDMKRLRHSQLYSVQLQPPMPEGPKPVEAPPTPPLLTEGDA